jgi:hypothetical protein
MSRSSLAAILVFVLSLLTPAAWATVYVVDPDGTGDFPTIQQAIDAIVDGDVIELTDGTFTGPGNRDLDYNGKAITVQSQSGNPQGCIIDCEGTEFQCHRGVYFHSGEGPASVLEGVTIARGYVSGPGGTPEDWGGAVLILDSSPTLTNCIFFGNQARDSGGGILCWDSSPTIAGCTFSRNMAQWGGGMQCLNSSTTFTDCTFYGNFGSANGGGLYDCLESSSTLTNVTFSNNSTIGKGGGMVCNASSAVLANCTFHSNAALYYGGGMWLLGGSGPTLENTIIAFGDKGEAIHCEASTPTLTCCDVYGNAGGDWVGTIADQYGVEGNISEDPRFCDPAHEDFTLHAASPCAPFSPPNAECDLIGAWPVGCGIHVVKPDGTGDFPTIQAAIDAAHPGEWIALTNGVFSGNGNHDLDYLGKAIVVRSQSGDPDSCIIECEGSAADPHRGFYFHSGEDAGSRLEAVTIRNGYAPGPDGYAGGIRCQNASPSISNCILADNTAQRGGGAYCTGSSSEFTQCILRDNTATVAGGGVACGDVSTIIFDRCTFSRNSAERGGGVHCDFSTATLASCTFQGNAASGTPSAGGGAECGSYAELVLRHTIIAFGPSGQAIDCGTSGSAVLDCCDIYGNQGGDWVGCIADQYGVNGNISLDPRFCDPDDDLRLWNYSPCNQETCGLIGAWPVGCWEPQAEKEQPEKSATTTSILLGNTPNPFGSSTRITYRLADGSRVQRVELGVYDIRGRLIRRLVDTRQPAGFYSVAWDATNNRHQPVQAGLYFYRLTVSGRWQTGRTVLLR